jgi:hypothetical protein
MRYRFSNAGLTNPMLHRSSVYIRHIQRLILPILYVCMLGNFKEIELGSLGELKKGKYQKTQSPAIYREAVINEDNLTEPHASRIYLTFFLEFFLKLSIISRGDGHDKGSLSFLATVFGVGPGLLPGAYLNPLAFPGFL